MNQSDNIKSHIELAQSLVNNGLAYKCYDDENGCKEGLEKKQLTESSHHFWNLEIYILILT